MTSAGIALLAFYLLVTVAIGLWGTKKITVETLVVNDRATGLVALTLSNVATIVGAGATVSVVSEINRTGISYAAVLAAYFLGGILLFFVAGRIRSLAETHNLASLVDLAGLRGGERCRKAMFVLQLVILLSWTAVQAAAFAVLAHELSGLSHTVSLLLAAIVTIGYSCLGGLRADIRTDAIQFAVMIVIFSLLASFSTLDFACADGLIRLDIEFWNPFGFGGVTWTVGALVGGALMYFGSSAHWQRIASARDVAIARKSYLYALPLLILFGCATILIGMDARVLGLETTGDGAIFQLINLRLGPTYSALGYAAIMAVIMSTADSLMVAGGSILNRQFAAKRQNSVSSFRLWTAGFGALAFVIPIVFPSVLILSLWTGYLAITIAPFVLRSIFGPLSGTWAIYLLLVPVGVLGGGLFVAPKLAFVPALLAGVLLAVIAPKPIVR